MSALDDELVEMVSEAIADVDAESDTAEFWELYRDQARAVLSVPALRDALARDAQVREIAPDAVWMAKLARGGSWPGGMAHAVDQAANKVIAALGDDVDRSALDAVAATLRDGKG